MEKNSNLKNLILETLDSNKALDIVSIDLKNKSSMADYLIIASGTHLDTFKLYQKWYWKN